jgi:protein-disulfide isomerase
LLTRRALGAVAGAVLLALAGCGQAGSAAGTAQAAEPALGEVFQGEATAPVTLIEYASVTCGACKSFHDQILPTIKARYVLPGHVKFVFREFPTPPVEIAMAGFAAARCAGPDGYFDVVDTLFAQQAAIFEAARAGQANEKLVEVLTPLGFNKARFEGCVGNEEILRTISQTVRGGEDAGVASTPTLFIDGQLVAREQTSLNGLQAALDAALLTKGITVGP